LTNIISKTNLPLFVTFAAVFAIIGSASMNAVTNSNGTILIRNAWAEEDEEVNTCPAETPDCSSGGAGGDGSGSGGAGGGGGDGSGSGNPPKGGQSASSSSPIQ
jgi:hypothetical protein